MGLRVLVAVRNLKERRSGWGRASERVNACKSERDFGPLICQDKRKECLPQPEARETALGHCWHSLGSCEAPREFIPYGYSLFTEPHS